MSKRFSIHNAHKDTLMFDCWQRGLLKLNPAFILPWQYPVPLRQIGHACPQQAGNNRRVAGVGSVHNRKSEKHAPLLSPPLKLIQADVTNTATLLGSFSKPLCGCDCITWLPWTSHKDRNYKITYQWSRLVQKMNCTHWYRQCRHTPYVFPNMMHSWKTFTQKSVLLINMMPLMLQWMWSSSLPPFSLTHAFIMCVWVCIKTAVGSSAHRLQNIVFL